MGWRLLGFEGGINSSVFSAWGARAEQSQASRERCLAKKCRRWQVGGQQVRARARRTKGISWAETTSVTTPQAFLHQRVIATTIPTFTFLRSICRQRGEGSVSWVTLGTPFWDFWMWVLCPAVSYFRFVSYNWATQEDTCHPPPSATMDTNLLAEDTLRQSWPNSRYKGA